MPDFNESYLIFFPLFIYLFIFILNKSSYFLYVRVSITWIDNTFIDQYGVCDFQKEIDFGRRENNVHHHHEYYIQLGGNEQMSDTLPVWQNLHDPLTWITYRANPSDPFWRR